MSVISRLMNNSQAETIPQLISSLQMVRIRQDKDCFGISLSGRQVATLPSLQRGTTSSGGIGNTRQQWSCVFRIISLISLFLDQTTNRILSVLRSKLFWHLLRLFIKIS